MGLYDITFNSISGLSLGFHAEKRPDIPVPQERIEQVIVPGRDGILTMRDGSIGTIEIKVVFSFAASSRDGFNEKVRLLKSWLLMKPKKELILSDDPNYFYVVNFVTAKSAQRKNGGRIGTVEVIFNCDGYTYLVSGKSEYAVNQVKNNPYEICHPIYRVTAAQEGSACTIMVNSKTFKIPVMPTEVVIDSDLMVATQNGYELGTYNKSVNGNYESLWLKSGYNSITVTSGYTMMVTPRWRVL